MTLSDIEKKLMEFLDKLGESMSPISDTIKGIIASVKNKFITPFELDQLSNLIDLYYDAMTTMFASMTNPEMRKIYLASAAYTVQKFGIVLNTSNIDFKALNILIKDMTADMVAAASGGKEYVKSYFRLSSQTAVTEAEISRLVAEGFIDSGTASKAKKALREGTEDLLSQMILDAESQGQFIDKTRRAELNRIAKMKVSDTVKARLRAEFEQKFADEKFMQIIDKNGNVRNYRVETYTNMVARTRLGDAQVLGSIEQGAEYGITEFKVTKHNTSTPICIPHEGVTYTTNPKNRQFEMLTEKNRPLYHPNCLHRLIPTAYTNNELSKMEAVR